MLWKSKVEIQRGIPATKFEPEMMWKIFEKICLTLFKNRVLTFYQQLLTESTRREFGK